jgi:16S rRNA (guanine966-N2)-methyltransferase
MRIVGGKYKGRTFHPGKKFKARPTTDIAKEGLFNILEHRYDFTTKTVLDLFSGTGSMAYEFISRGCQHATLVENNFIHYKFIQEVITKLNIDNAKVFKTNVFLFLKKSPETFNIIFADPPFDFQNFETIPEAVLQNSLLAPQGVFVLEHPATYDFSHHPYFKEHRKYGKVNFSFFEKD